MLKGIGRFLGIGPDYKFGGKRQMGGRIPAGTGPIQSVGMEAGRSTGRPSMGMAAGYRNSPSPGEMFGGFGGGGGYHDPTDPTGATPTAKPGFWGGIAKYAGKHPEVITGALATGADIYGSTLEGKAADRSLDLREKQMRDEEEARKRQEQIEQLQMLMQGMVGFRPRY